MRRMPVLMLFLLLVLASPASAQTLQADTQSVDRAVNAFRGGDLVYVDPDARDVLPQSQEEGLEEDIAAAGGGIFIAVFPGEAGGERRAALEIGEQIMQDTGERGTYGVAVVSSPDSGSLVAGSTELRRGLAPRLAQQAAAGAGSVSQGLAQFVSSVDSARSGAGAGGAVRNPGTSSGGGSGFLVLLGILAVVFGVSRFRRNRRHKRVNEERMADLRRVATDDLVALGGDIRALDLDVEMPGANPEAKQRYAEAVEAYIRAEEAMNQAHTPEDFKPIGKELEEGRYDIAAARALLQGEEAPERRPPCFFDPRHGPSVTDVEWAPPGGQPRPVPLCAADAVRVQEGEEPMSREIVLGGQRMPYWQAPGQFAPFYAGGMFGGFGGLATGMLFGSMMSGAMYGGWGVGDAYASGGDFGGGDFGGGDFGGGFGGGDFGGGGFGGGDFG